MGAPHRKKERQNTRVQADKIAVVKKQGRAITADQEPHLGMKILIIDVKNRTGLPCHCCSTVLAAGCAMGITAKPGRMG